MSYKRGDRVETLVQGEWRPGVIVSLEANHGAPDTCNIELRLDEPGTYLGTQTDRWFTRAMHLRPEPPIATLARAKRAKMA